MKPELFSCSFVQDARMAQIPQKKYSSLIWRIALIYFFLYISTLTFDYYLFEGWFDFVSVPFRWLAEQTGMLFFGVNLLGADKFYSDSLLVYVHLFDILMISIIAASIWTFFAKTSTTPRQPSATLHGGQALSLTRFTATKYYPFLLTLLRYFVALNLFVYGFSKLYKWQFMLPEPNILYTSVGEMHRDMLYWTSMGTSRSYSIFMGLIEIIPGILLLFRRTTLIGAFISLMVMANVVAINFGFDITVKLHSLTLMLMSLVILIPGRKRILALFTGKATEEWKYPALVIAPNKKWIAPVLKVAAIALLVAEAHHPYTLTGTFNDDDAERPPMHGAYEVVYTSVPSDSLPENQRIEMIFIHRRGYIIFKMEDETMVDYPVTINSSAQTMIYERGNFQWSVNQDSLFVFTGELEGSKARYHLRRMEIDKMPLMEEEFTWIDED